eukprot:NODE_831_length_589_cov_573.740260_g821_i0.p2 GENE.NODE_831_length_589_cov_573.740260_g821_i0~~NODE_831_length_589_cov_573.740260_g821_i0.p2  ORF type:complete len:59 (-),score=15.51 NODE_831_length_589_cov_573.740260_g821_i0:65-241(-)
MEHAFTSVQPPCGGEKGTVTVTATGSDPQRETVTHWNAILLSSCVLVLLNPFLHLFFF